jgi:Flp pilus assembly protein TadG
MRGAAVHWARLIASDTSGAVAIYVTALAALMIGLIGFAVDAGRLFTTNSEAKAAADAAALAAASQLDGSSSAISRAIVAAQTSPLVSNVQTHATGSHTVTITSMRFFWGVPDDTQVTISSSYETTDPEQARFVEVTTQQLTQDNFFVQALAAGQTTGSTGAIAVAGFKRTVCRFPPLMICNPFETATYHEFPTDSVRGDQLLAKTNQGGSSAWAPGDFGLLDPPDDPFDTTTNSGAKRVAQEIARADPRACYSADVNIRPGTVASMSTGLNVRFDLYGNPYFGNGASRSDPEYRPARNVVKGMVTSGGACSATTSPLAQKMPEDTCLASGTCATPLPTRLGDGNWNRTLYWTVNHPGVAMPSALASASRYDFYRYEIDNGMIPNNSAAGGENGNPQCYSGSVTPNDNPDRRVLYMAVINCIEQGPLNGSSNTNVKVKAFAKMFFTEPVPSSSSTDVWLEFINIVKPGADDGVLHDQIELVR